MRKPNIFGNFRIFKFFDKRNLGFIPRMLVSSFLLISFFYSIPSLIILKKEKSLEYQNNSKAVLAYTLNQKGGNVEADNYTLDEKDLLVDIFSLNDLETDTVRLNASTIKQLFEDTNYKLEDVRKKN